MMGNRRETTVDKGYAWIILTASALILTILVGFLKCTGIFFVEFQRRFNANVSVISLVDMFHNFAYSISAVLVTTVGLKFFSSRHLVMLGGILHGFCFIITAVAEHIGILYWFRGVLNGISFGFIYPPVIAIIGVYFEKHRGLANSIAMLGPCIGGLLFAPFVTRLFEEYLYTGAFLIIAGVALNITVCGLILRPLRTSTKAALTQANEEMNTEILHENECSADVEKMLNETGSIQADRLILASKNSSPKMAKLYLTAGLHSRLSDKNPQISSLLHITRSQELQRTNVNEDLKYQDICSLGTHVDISFSESDLRRNTRGPRSISIRDLIEHVVCKIDNVPSTRLSSAEFLPDSALDKTSTDAVPRQTNETNNAAIFNENICASCDCGIAKVCVMIFDPNLLKNPVFAVILLCAGLLSVGVVSCIIFVPPLAKDLNIPADKIALLLSINNLVDLFSRVIFGIISDRGWIRRSTILGVTALAMGIPSHFVRFIRSFPMLMAYSVILGLFQGVYPAYYAVVIVDYLKLENLRSTLGYSILMHGSFVSAAFPIIGFLRDHTGTYVTSYHFLGVALNMAALMAFSLPVVEKWNQ